MSLERRWRRVAWHTIGLLIAGVLAWLIVRAYRQPDFVIDMFSGFMC